MSNKASSTMIGLFTLVGLLIAANAVAIVLMMGDRTMSATRRGRSTHRGETRDHEHSEHQPCPK